MHISHLPLPLLQIWLHVVDLSFFFTYHTFPFLLSFFLLFLFSFSFSFFSTCNFIVLFSFIYSYSLLFSCVNYYWQMVSFCLHCYFCNVSSSCVPFYLILFSLFLLSHFSFSSCLYNLIWIFSFFLLMFYIIPMYYHVIDTWFLLTLIVVSAVCHHCSCTLVFKVTYA